MFFSITVFTVSLHRHRILEITCIFKGIKRKSVHFHSIVDHDPRDNSINILVPTTVILLDPEGGPGVSPLKVLVYGTTQKM